MPSQNTETTSTSTISRMIDLLKCMILPISPHWRREINNEIRNVMLVAAALIATVTFQAGITPPGGVWQNDDDKGHRAGRAVFSDQKAFFHIFLTFNTIALTSSISVLLCLTFGCPYFLEILIATICMVVTYTSGIQCIAPDEPLSFRLLFVAAPAPAVIRMQSQNTETTSKISMMINPLKFIISPTSPPWKTETTGDIRNVMLVGAALIATVTFQAGITPPGGVWQDNKDGHKDGYAVYSEQEVPFQIFLICNTIDSILTLMDSRLFDAILSGDITAFRSLLAEDPLILARISLNSTENPLHLSLLAGQLEITRGVACQKPAYIRELNQDGFSPIHIAASDGHAELGKDGKAPLHFAAMKGRVDISNQVETVKVLIEEMKKLDLRKQHETIGLLIGQGPLLTE
ncbi:hypothetical protein SADUNF_Sadunf14G0032500 [Salix dunnii]|uniref:PGG domain-containing protein n=1 Tax=Salix dunnii TaxID=1413687 RepID=A0A835JCL3_9ROSI|nr:hypothetical protein SADUNF_Sadunf14G0032500 [Salix dunnii]